MLIKGIGGKSIYFFFTLKKFRLEDFRFKFSLDEKVTFFKNEFLEN